MIEPIQSDYFLVAEPSHCERDKTIEVEDSYLFSRKRNQGTKEEGKDEVVPHDYWQFK